MSKQTDTNADREPVRPSVLLGVAHLTALWALAFLQPMLSLLGKSPEFFVARSNSPGQIILYAVTLAFGPPLVALVIELVANRISPKLRWGIHLFLMGVVGAALALTLAKRYLDWSAALLIGLSVLVAIAGVWTYDRWRFPKAFMDLLTPAPLVILAVFLFLSPATRVIIPDQNPEAQQIEIGNPARVVMVIFDEFPLASLMKDGNSIDASRYPNFAALAGQSTWYRNASAAGAYTPVAVPTILTGRRAGLDDLPIASDHPKSIFTLLGGSYELQVNERITKICPDSLCPAEEDLGYDSETGALFSDLFVVSQHLLLPNSMRKNLPDISRAFGGFGDDGYGNDDLTKDDGQAGQKFERTGRGGVRQLGRVFAGARQEEVQDSVTRFNEGLGNRKREKLDVIHMLEPHVPWNHVPSGQRYTLTEHWSRLIPDDRQWQAPQRVVDIALQRGLLEVGFTDTLLGSIKTSLEEKGLWDDSLVVVTADHGAAFESRIDRRKATAQNIGSIASVPLFIKSPGQKESEVVERHTCASDILPEVANLLEIEYPWEVEDCPADTVEVLNPPTGSVKAPVSAMVQQRDRFIERIDSLFSTGTGWGPVYRSGPRRELIGRPVSGFRRLPETEDQFASPERRNAAKRFDPDAAVLPALLQRGPVRGVGAKQIVAVAVDDRIQGVGWTFRDRILDSPGYSILLPPNALEPGFNKVDVYLVEQGGKALRKLYSGAGPVD